MYAPAFVSPGVFAPRSGVEGVWFCSKFIRLGEFDSGRLGSRQRQTLQIQDMIRVIFRKKRLLRSKEEKQWPCEWGDHSDAFPLWSSERAANLTYKRARNLYV